jgi:ATP-binding cassette subfamily B protein
MHLPARRKKQAFLLLFLIFVASAFELITIASLVPFLGVITVPQKVFENSLAAPFIDYLNINDPSEIALPFTVLFCVAIIASAFIRIMHIWFSTRLAYAIGNDLSCRVFSNSLNKSYAHFLSSNSSELVNSVATKINVVIQNVVYPCISLFGASIMLLIILGVLFILQPIVSLVLIVSFGLFYLGIILYIRKKLYKNSLRVSSESAKQVKIIQESLGGIRDVIIDRNQEFYVSIFTKVDYLYRRAQASTSIIGQSPRFIIEASGIIGIAIFALFNTSSSEELGYTVALLGALAYGAQRLMPILQLAFSSYSSLQGGYMGLADILAILDEKNSSNLGNVEVDFDHEIAITNGSFGYQDSSEPVFTSLNVNIRKGDRIGIVGETGCGKSTFVDCLMGLLSFDDDSLKVDGVSLDDSNVVSWRRRIAHVPQTVYLCDGTVLENIAFGVPFDEIEIDRVMEAAEIAQISDFIQTLPDGYHSIVGERGSQLSGGQIQRIGIARAFYKQAEVIIFDEATSALDQKTEKNVMEAIERHDNRCTIVIIAHRKSTLSFCSKILEFTKNEGVFEYSRDEYNSMLKPTKRDREC